MGTTICFAGRPTTVTRAQACGTATTISERGAATTARGGAKSRLRSTTAMTAGAIRLAGARSQRAGRRAARRAAPPRASPGAESSIIVVSAIAGSSISPAARAPTAPGRPRAVRTRVAAAPRVVHSTAATVRPQLPAGKPARSPLEPATPSPVAGLLSTPAPCRRYRTMTAGTGGKAPPVSGSDGSPACTGSFARWPSPACSARRRGHRGTRGLQPDECLRRRGQQERRRHHGRPRDDRHHARLQGRRLQHRPAPDREHRERPRPRHRPRHRRSPTATAPSAAKVVGVAISIAPGQVGILALDRRPGPGHRVLPGRHSSGKPSIRQMFMCPGDAGPATGNGTVPAVPDATESLPSE